MIALASVASICTGVTMPLMNVVFGKHLLKPHHIFFQGKSTNPTSKGRVFGSFTGYDKAGNVVVMTEEMFMKEIIQCVYVFTFALPFPLSV